MYEFFIYLFIFLFYIHWLYKSQVLLNLFIYIILSYYFITANITIQNANIYTILINFISTIWTLNEHYIYIQLIFIIFLIYIFIQQINKNNKITYPILFFLYSLLLLMLLSNYTLLDNVLFFSKTITNFNIILSHTLVSIHPPLILLSIIFIRCLTLILNIYILNYRYSNTNLISKYNVLIYYILTFSIVLGSFWSINLFGWGGWWIWDPIENISLLYWLFIILIIHLTFTFIYYIYIYLFILIYDYLFYCTFKLSLLNSLHIFKNTLTTLNINYLLYVIFLYILFVLLYYVFFRFKRTTVKQNNINKIIYYILFFLFFQYVYLLLIKFTTFIIYPNILLNLLYISLLYILYIEIVKETNYITSFFFYFFIFVFLFNLFYSINIILIFISYSFLLFIKDYKKINSYYMLNHYVILCILLLLILFTFNTHSIVQSNILNHNIMLNKLLIISHTNIFELNSSILFNHILILDYIHYNISLLNQIYFDNINLFQKNELNYVLFAYYNYLINIIFNNIYIIKLMNIQYIIIATILSLVFYIYSNYSINVHNKYIN